MPGRLDTHVLTVRIQYCGGWGYGRYSRALRAFLRQEFGDVIAVEESQDVQITGNFEVTLIVHDKRDEAALIHSGRAEGKGKATTAEERQWIVEQIREALERV